MILCCGDALIDMIPARTEDGAMAWMPFAGGAVLNTAVALGRLEAPVGLLAGLSTDSFGRILRETLTEAKVDTSLAVATDRKTTLAFVALKDGQADYSFYDEHSAMRMLRIGDIPLLPTDVSTLFFGGISLASEPCGTALEDLQMREGASRMTVLDPNVRSAFLTDEAAYRARIDRMMCRSDIVKVSDEDLMWLLPDDRPLEAKMQAILDRGPMLVVTTLGSAGVTAFSRDGLKITLPARSVPIVDTVGAGDAFNAGFLARLQEMGGADTERLRKADASHLEDALDYGVAAAAYVVSKAGAQPPHKNEIVRAR